jgi:hypothetical protein
MTTENPKEVVVDVSLQPEEEIPQQIMIRLNKTNISPRLRTEQCSCLCGSSSGGGAGQ